MGEAFYLYNASILLECGEMPRGSILIKNGKISKIHLSKEQGRIPEEAEIIDAAGLIAVPGFIDGHIHGAAGKDIMDATEEAIDSIARFLPLEGTTSFLATTMTASKQKISKVLQNIGSYENKPGQAEMLGAHLEGPFLSKSKAGAQPQSNMIDPTIDWFQTWQRQSQKRIKVITLAPELDRAGNFIAYLKDQGVTVSAGHTNADFEAVKRAVDHGVHQLTHLCNAMNGLHHREIGAVGAAFLLDELKAELIADGFHVSPEMMKLIYRNMGSERLMLITDSMRAKGLPDGKYELGGQSVTVSGKQARLPDQTLAGSVLNMSDGVRRMIQLTGCTLHDIAQMTAVNPAKQIRVFDRKGSLTEGKDADILLIDKNYHIQLTFCRGIIVEQGEA